MSEDAGFALGALPDFTAPPSLLVAAPEHVAAYDIDTATVPIPWTVASSWSAECSRRCRRASGYPTRTTRARKSSSEGAFAGGTVQA